MSLLDALSRAGGLRTFDHAFAQSLRRLDPDTPDAVLAAAALAALAVASGHAGLDLDAASDLVEADIDWPEAGEWRRQLAASRWVATPDAADQPADAQAPLVLEGRAGGGLLYLRRYREYERQLAAHLQRIAAARVDGGYLAALAPLFERLFPDADADGDDRQARAAALALRHPLLMVTGGPGTGKTTTIARLLVLLAAQARAAGRAAPRIALAAPTGRAAERMAESVRAALAVLRARGLEPGLTDSLPTTGSTLHRLLGTLPDTPYFRHHADDPLPCDLVVIDEASMIDLPLMAKLVDAIAEGTRLILIGDPDQLPSVEAGDVLSGILRAAGDGDRLAPDDAEAVVPLLASAATGAITTATTVVVPDPDPDPSAVVGVGGPKPSADARTAAPASGARTGFAGRRVHLQRGWRQSASLHLAPLADAVRAGDSVAALALLRADALSGVHFHAALADPLHSHRDELLAHWQALANASDPSDALVLASRLRLLTAVREGPQGARSLNARIETLLAGPQRRGREHFHGRLIIVTENSYRHGLFNGDIGICLRDDADAASASDAAAAAGSGVAGTAKVGEGPGAAVPARGETPSEPGRDRRGALMAWFPGHNPGQLRAFHPAALPAHESAFAMTVHKSQGSEFDSVWLLLPARVNRVLSRELVYTGITRARRELHLAASPDILAQALSRHAQRWSGLTRRLLACRRGAAADIKDADNPRVPAAVEKKAKTRSGCEDDNR